MLAEKHMISKKLDAALKSDFHAKTPSQEWADTMKVEALKSRYDGVEDALHNSPQAQILAQKHAISKKLDKALKTDFHAKTPSQEWADTMKVEALKSRFDAISDAVERAPQLLSQLPGPRIVDPRTGQVYGLYEYHVPGGYEDAELMPQEPFANDLKGIAPFEWGIERNPIYQGVYHNLGGGGEEPAEKSAQVPQLYQFPGQILAEAPSQFVMRDRNGGLRLVSAAQIEGLQLERLHEEQAALAMRRNMRAQMAQLRHKRAEAQPPQAKKAPAKAPLQAPKAHK
jgi:hypothetical protein